MYLNSDLHPTPEEQAPIKTEPQRRSTKKLVAIVLAIVIPLILLATGGYFFLRYTRESQKEEAAFQALSDSRSSQDYSDFLNRFPHSSHRSIVEAQRDAYLKLETDWQRIRQSSNVAAFRQFRSQCTDPYYLQLCEQKIDSLDWVEAQNENTLEAFQNYLIAHPSGPYSADASILVEKLQKTVLSADEQTSVESVIKNFFYHLGNNNQEAIASNITPVLSRFLNKRNATKADVLNMVQEMFTEDIYSSHFQVNDDFAITRETADDGTVTYQATCSVDQYIKRLDEGKTFGSYKVNVEVDKNLKIKSLIMSEISRR